MSTQVEGGRAVARFRIFGFPVHVDISFLVIIGLLGWFSSSSLPSHGVEAFVLWMIIAPLSILLHELGHAFVARTTGAKPSIALAGMGGLTTFEPPRPMSRARSFAVSISGPAVGIVIGLPLWWLWRYRLDETWSLTSQIVIVWAWWTSLGWALLNLAPVLPLDGGQAMRELLPGDPQVRARRAAVISIGSGVVLAIVAFAWQQPWVAIFFALFGLTNFLSLRRPVPPTPEKASVDQQVVGLLWQGRPQEARQVLQAAPAGAVSDLAVHGAVLATTGDVDQGMALLHQEASRRPQDVDVLALFALATILRGDWDGLLGLLRSPQGPLVPDVVVSRGREVAVQWGRPDVASAIASLRPDAQPGVRPSE